MTFADTTVTAATRELRHRLRKAKLEHQSLSDELQRSHFERWLISLLVKSAESIEERDDWELEEAALACITLSHQRQLDLLSLDIKRLERLLELAKRQRQAMP